VLIRLLARVMRGMPTDIRRVDMIWQRLYSRLGGGAFSDCEAVDNLWPAGVQPAIRGKKHRKLMHLNLQSWVERRTYFTGRYYQHEIEELLHSLLQPGDQFIDVGANIGMVSLIAASRIGSKGRGLAFEPNPEVHQRLKSHFEINDISNIAVVPFAVGDQPGTATLSVQGRNTGLGTLTRSDPGKGRTVEVEVARVDDFAGELAEGRPTVIKIDVEGYECRVLAGMANLLSRPETVLIVEVTDEMLRRVGSSSRNLHDMLASRGFDAYSIRLDRERWRRHLRLERLTHALDVQQYDAVFARASDQVFRDRIQPLL